MESYGISQMARLFGLSRSSLLYYDRIGLLAPSNRTDAGYRVYTRTDRDRLDRIHRFRQAGLPLADIRKLLVSGEAPSAVVLEKRFRKIGDEIRELKTKQDLLAHMLKQLAIDCPTRSVDKTMWVEMLRAAGMDDQAMQRWHSEFEARAPEAHHEFLLSLGISAPEAHEIRRWSRRVRKTGRTDNQATHDQNQVRKSK